MSLVALAAAAVAAEPPAATLSTAAPAAADEAPRTTSLKLALVPGVGISAGRDTAVDGLAVGVVAMSPTLRGFDAELGVSWVDGTVDGLQGALGITVAGDVDGAQGTAGLAWARGDVGWAQLAGGAALAEGDVRGVQAAGGLAVTGGTLSGVQSAPLVIADGVAGLQAGMVTVGGDVRGAQLGLLNVGRDVNGLQLGLVNVARTSKVSIAPLNFIGDGLHRVDVWAADSAVGNVAVKFGSRHVYTLLGAGWVNPSQPWWSFGGGLGVHLPAGPVWLELDDSAWSLAAGNVLVPGVRNTLRASVGVDLVKRHLAPFAGVSVNTWYGTGRVAPRAIGVPEWADEQRRLVAWPGVHAGVSF